MDDPPLATPAAQDGADRAYRLARVLVADVYARTRASGDRPDLPGSAVRRAAVATATGLLPVLRSDSPPHRRQSLLSGLRAIAEWIESERRDGRLGDGEAERLAWLHRELEQAITDAAGPPPS